MLQKSILRLSIILLKAEEKCGLLFTSLLITIFLTACAALYAEPVFAVTYHGIPFSKLSENPFDFSSPNPMHYRILSPALGYLLFLRGKLFFIFPLLITGLFSGIVYLTCRKKNFLPVDSFLLTCFITFSIVILLPLRSPGYTDVITWLLLFLAFTQTQKIWMSALCFSLALLNHESAIVMLPALIMINRYENKNQSLIIVFSFFIACIPHLAWRWVVHQQGGALYSISFYLSEHTVYFSLKKLFAYLPAAAFYTFKLWWIFPLTLAARFINEKDFQRFLILALILAGAFSLTLISYDYTRMLAISFPAVLLSARWWMEIKGMEQMRKYFLAAILLNFLILQYHVNYDGLQPMFPWIINKLSAHFGMPLH